MFRVCTDNSVLNTFHTSAQAEEYLAELAIWSPDVAPLCYIEKRTDWDWDWERI